MRRDHRVIRAASLAALLVSLAAATRSDAQERSFFSREPDKEPNARAPVPPGHGTTVPYGCVGPVQKATDVAFEGVKTTSHNWSNANGAGESGRFDKNVVLTTRVTLLAGSCLDAHLSALVGSKQAYASAASMTMFQVTLTPAVPGGVPRHMVGHYETPYGTYGPAVALEPERDVDTFASSFIQRVGTGPGDVAPGLYRVDVWWAGGPVGGGGAIGAAFVLKLYHR